MDLLDKINPFISKKDAREKHLIKNHRYVELYNVMIEGISEAIDKIFKKETDPEIKALGKYTRNIFMDLKHLARFLIYHEIYYMKLDKNIDPNELDFALRGIHNLPMHQIDSHEARIRKALESQARFQKAEVIENIHEQTHLRIKSINLDIVKLSGYKTIKTQVREIDRLISAINVLVKHRWDKAFDLELLTVAHTFEEVGDAVIEEKEAVLHFK